jgi:hypothetical protein
MMDNFDYLLATCGLVWVQVWIGYLPTEFINKKMFKKLLIPASYTHRNNTIPSSIQRYAQLIKGNKNQHHLVLIFVI